MEGQGQGARLSAQHDLVVALVGHRLSKRYVPNERRTTRVSKIRRTSVEPSLEDRSASAAALAGYAVNLFEQAADSLDEAAAEQQEVAYQAEVEIDRLAALRDNAGEQALGNLDAALRIRTLIA